jgi:1-acyl-sn-glycerol-3-phosphate acyltransferase
MRYIRSIFFDLTFALITIWFAVIGLPLGLTKKYSLLLGKAWAKTVLFALRVICGIVSKCDDIKELNSCNLILSKHQSAWETIFFLAELKNPAFVIKEELTRVPFYGWYLKNMGMITVKRVSSARELKRMNNGILNALKCGKNVIIFPQGTRVAADMNNFEKPFRLNCLEVFAEFSGKIATVGINGGLFWKKGFSIKKSGLCRAKIGDIFDVKSNKYQDLSKQEINELKEKISNSIEKTSRDLL